VIAAATALLFAGAPARGITNGQLDGSRHPEVGALLYDWDPTLARRFRPGRTRPTPRRSTAVGYGISGVTFGGGWPAPVPEDGVRRYAVSDFLGLTPVWLMPCRTRRRGTAGPCAGDAGGPHFLGAGSSETDIVVATTVTGGGTSDTYRLDSDSARSYLGNYVAVP
jgi:hypothetical protein